MPLPARLCGLLCLSSLEHCHRETLVLKTGVQGDPDSEERQKQLRKPAKELGGAAMTGVVAAPALLGALLDYKPAQSVLSPFLGPTTAAHSGEKGARHASRMVEAGNPRSWLLPVLFVFPAEQVKPGEMRVRRTHSGILN